MADRERTELTMLVERMRLVSEAYANEALRKRDEGHPVYAASLGGHHNGLLLAATWLAAWLDEQLALSPPVELGAIASNQGGA